MAESQMRRFTIEGRGPRLDEAVQFSDGTVVVRCPGGFDAYTGLDALTAERPRSSITWIDEETSR